MYRVLLVDDEIHICQLIRHLVDWDALRAELCGVAHDGVEALELVGKLRPHVVISDIRMSGMDGISLLEKIRQSGIECAFILVSGYRQFDYAQKAIQLGVTDYLVKPIKKRELNAAIEKGIAGLRLQGDGREKVPEPAGGLEAPFPRGLAELARAIEDRGGDFGQATLAALVGRYGGELPGCACLIYGKFVCGEAFSARTQELLYDRVRSAVGNGGWFDAVFFARWGGGFLLVGSSRGRLPGVSFLQGKLQAVLSVFAQWIVILGMSEPLEGEPFRNCACRARQAAEQHYFHPGKTAFTAVETPPPQVRFEDVAEGWAALPDAMQVLDEKGVRKVVQSGFRALEGAPFEELFRYAEWVINMMNQALSAFAAAQTGLEDLQYLHRNEILEQLYHCPSLVSLTAKLCAALEEKICSTRGLIEQMENKPVRIVRELVAQRYMEHISLGDAADATGLNPVYLSVLFKKETGINFKDYVVNVRMDKAKGLLRSGESINRVAELVGYQDAKYFSRLFARVVGVNPTQYKKLYQ
ncbi:MAG: response regulator [Oscillibacter sp.]|nr:response regulator [Oscillibacter sp.]